MGSTVVGRDAQRRTTRKARRTPAWTTAHAHRLAWRAGFGATPKELEALRRAGKHAAVAQFVDGDQRGTRAVLRGPAPSVAGKPLDPGNEFDHDVLWWLDRMVRTSHPLQERMTLFWHDHFATADLPASLMLAQNETLRRHALGSFDALLRAVFLDPAMQIHLSVAGSVKEDPNENFARELFELYTLGAGNGYTETDIREAARALTGWVLVKSGGQVTGVRFDPRRHDSGTKTIFGQTGTWGWEDVLRLTLARKGVAEFIVGKLWDEFVGTPLATKTRRSLVKQFQASGRSIRTLMRAILRAPQLYADLPRPDLVKSPVVLIAGLLRTNGWRIDRRDWAALMTVMGQRPFRPPSVAGWDGGPAWCSTAAFRARFVLPVQVLDPKRGLAPVVAGTVDPGLTPAAHLSLAKRALGEPFTTSATDKRLRVLAARIMARPAKDDAARRRNAETAQRALRTLLIAGPDYQLL
ncbi:DUF1800 family protein [Paraconexibacter sp.]|uniref:DUF1800 domain-containing protein n=1 Tax=Paraconexibacter sp. TaxID=2949640 RepID=UPI003569D30C